MHETLKAHGLCSINHIKSSEPGSKVSRTIDIFTLPGIVYLVHDDKNVIEHDYQAIREMEKGGLFGLK